ncbi:hypothetical protein AYI69_g8058 [Smittium culicis]|uniref:BED-type domain-containing protein n=1 Tax=Smittium culicis TaxID=133412 RepID=A0A1R1XMH7_9FUNG|nr:hypothetical protein AYI69_g8058 [Smittium culicis]
MNKKKVWGYYIKSDDKKHGTCKTCGKMIKIEGGSTSGLHYDIRSMHSTDLINKNLQVVLPDDTSSSEIQNKVRNTKLSDFISTYGLSLPAII